MGEIILKTNNLTVDFKIKKNIFGKPDRLSAVQNANIERSEERRVGKEC